MFFLVGQQRGPVPDHLVQLWFVNDSIYESDSKQQKTRPQIVFFSSFLRRKGPLKKKKDFSSKINIFKLLLCCCCMNKMQNFLLEMVRFWYKGFVFVSLHPASFLLSVKLFFFLLLRNFRSDRQHVYMYVYIPYYKLLFSFQLWEYLDFFFLHVRDHALTPPPDVNVVGSLLTPLFRKTCLLVCTRILMNRMHCLCVFERVCVCV